MYCAWSISLPSETYLENSINVIKKKKKIFLEKTFTYASFILLSWTSMLHHISHIDTKTCQVETGPEQSAWGFTRIRIHEPRMPVEQFYEDFFYWTCGRIVVLNKMDLKPSCHGIRDLADLSSPTPEYTFHGFWLMIFLLACCQGPERVPISSLWFRWWRDLQDRKLRVIFSLNCTQGQGVLRATGIYS